MSIAASPARFSLGELSEIEFTGQSPAPFSVPSTPQLQDHDMMQDTGIGVMGDESEHFTKQPSSDAFDEHIALPLYAISSPFSQLFGNDPSQDYHMREYNVPGIASSLTASLTTLPQKCTQR